MKPVLVPLLVAAIILPACPAGIAGPVTAPSESTRTARSTATDPARRLTATDADIAEFFETFIARKVQELEIPGAAVVVIRDGRTILSRGFGVADLASGQPVDVERTVFRAASISKLLPWLLAMQLVEAGRLDLDAGVSQYVGFDVPARDGVAITMRHLMTHTAGFPERFHGVFDPDVATPLAVKLLEHRATPVYRPGTTIAYANYGAGLAGHVIEKRHAQPWDDIVWQRIFEPLDMQRSTVAQPVPSRLAADLASTYPHPDPHPAPFRTTSMAPLGSLSATAADMGRLLAMLVDGARGVDGPIVSAASVQRMMTLAHPLGPGLPDGMGLGFLVGEYRGIRYAGHAGNMATLATDLEVLPEHGLGWYFVLTSQGPGEHARKVRDELLHAAIDTLLPGGGQAPTAEGVSSAADVAGDYISTRRLKAGPLMFSGLMNTTAVSANEDGSLTIHSAGTETHWRPAGRDRFVDDDTGIPLAVTRNVDGRVHRIASAALYPAAEFERPPAFAQLVPPVAAFSLVVMFGAMLVRPVDIGMRWWHRRRNIATAEATGRRTGRLQSAARFAFAGLCAMLLGWVAIGLSLAIDFANLFTVPGIIRIGLGTLTLLTGPFALVLLADAIAAWRFRPAGLVRRLGTQLLALAACGLAWLVYVLDVWNFSTDW